MAPFIRWFCIVSCLFVSGLVIEPAKATVATAAPNVTNVCKQRPPTESAPSAGGEPQSPLVANRLSRLVVMEYEAWFGPGSGIHPQANVTTCLQSGDMQSTGGGYDSADPGVIATHVAWLERTGIDAVTLDLTNNVSCIYDGDDAAILRTVCPAVGQRSQNLSIRANDLLLYPAWTKLRTRLKIVPLLGGFDPYALTPDPEDPAHRCALEKEIDDFGARMAAYPTLDVLYEGKPLLLIYLGTPVDPQRATAIRNLLHASRLERRFSFRLMAGYLDSQPRFWAHPNQTPSGPIEIAQTFGFWSVVDRLNFWKAPPEPYYPTYARAGSRIENMTASFATAGQSGWNCSTTGGRQYCPDAALRYCGAGFQNGCRTGDYETLHEFMRYARTLQPIFLFIDQFNEFTQPDEGWDTNTNDDAEPTREWGYTGLQALIDEIRAYRAGSAP